MSRCPRARCVTFDGTGISCLPTNMSSFSEGGGRHGTCVALWPAMSMTAACQSEAPLKLPASVTATLVRRTGDDESDLVARLRRGDEAAFEVVVRRYGSRLLATARRLLGNEADARDAVQEAFLSAMKGMETFGGAA